MIVMTGWGVITTLLLLGKDKELASVCIKPTSPWANWCTSDLIWITKYIWVPHSGLVVWLHLLVTLSVDFWISKRISSELSSMTFLGGVVLDCGRGWLVGLAIGGSLLQMGAPPREPRWRPGTQAPALSGALLAPAASIWSSSDAAAALLPTMLPPPPSAPVGRQGTAAVWDNITRSRSYSSLGLTSTDPPVQQQHLWPALFDKAWITPLTSYSLLIVLGGKIPHYSRQHCRLTIGK